MRQYNRIMLGKAAVYAETCRKENYIGADFNIYEDLTGSLYDNWRMFNKKFLPIWMNNVPDRSKTSGGLQCGFLWTIAKGLQNGDIVLCPSGKGFYYIGEINGDYYYVPNTNLPHRRPVKWYEKILYRSQMSEKLQNSSGSIGTCCNITKYSEELERLIFNETQPTPQQPTATKQNKPKNYEERDLHKLFCNWLLTKKNIFAKTIYHERSNMSDKAQKWVHPDIVGVEFEEFEKDATLSLLKATEPKETVNLYSFEMKRKIENDGQLKEAYFQALSNSSWANYGYLVVYEINEGMDDEMARLNNAFGIGVIHMEANNCTVLYKAREHKLDFNTIDKLNRISSDFEEFIGNLSKVLNAPKNYAKDARRTFEDCCDKIFNDDSEIEAYCQEKNIPIL